MRLRLKCLYARRKRTAFLERRPADSPSSGAALPIADALSVGRGHASKGGDEYYDNQDQKGHGKGHNRTSATYELARENDAVESAKSVRIQEAAGVRQRQQRPYNKSIKTKLPSRPIPKLPPKSLKGAYVSIDDWCFIKSRLRHYHRRLFLHI